MKLDKWQQEVMETKGNIVLRSGRQVGKSSVIAQLVGSEGLKKKMNIMVVAAVEREALLLFEKIFDYIYNENKKEIAKGKDKPTKHKIILKNGTTINCLPTGQSGIGIRGHTIDLLVADEAAFIPQEVWSAITPMISTRIKYGARMILLSTPFGREGYFYNCFQDDTFTSFHVSSEDCERIDKTFLEEEGKRMSKVQYAQEYLGEFVNELRQFFPDKLIQKVMILDREYLKPSLAIANSSLYLGVDVARLGRDESTFEIVEKRGDRIIQKDNIITKKQLTTQTTKLILTLESKNNFKKIYIDDGGVGAGVFDQLLEEESTRRKVEAINNSSRPLTKDAKRNKKILKEDLYTNLLRLMEQGRIDLLKDDEIFLSLKSVQYEYDRGKLKIFGNYTHITEGLIRAAWCMKEKGLNIYVY